jgi:signal transduction histidine kinase
MASDAAEKDDNARANQPPLERLERLFEEATGGLVVPADARERAGRRATAALDASKTDAQAGEVVLLGFAADMLCALAVELAAHPAELRGLIDALDRSLSIPRVALGCAVLGSPQLLQLPTAVAVEVQLTLLLGFAKARAVSLWTLGTAGELKQIGHAGAFKAQARETRQLAREMLAGKPPKAKADRDVAGVLLDRRHELAAALIARGADVAPPGRTVLLDAAAPVLTAILERDELLSRKSISEDVIASTERRLARLRYDLHDGPQQDVVLLAEDLRFFRSQLRTAFDGHPIRERVAGRLDDLQARLVALDGDLRRISVSVQSPFLQAGSLADTLAQLTDDFAARTGIEPDTRFEGDFTRLTDSQYITLVGLIRESLSNIREHSDAEHVTISLASGVGGLEATVTDDGRGFDPETTLVRAAREGHLGLVGMHERVRLLGGRTQIDSRSGGPTVISISLPPPPPAAPRRGD